MGFTSKQQKPQRSKYPCSTSVRLTLPLLMYRSLRHERFMYDSPVQHGAPAGVRTIQPRKEAAPKASHLSIGSLASWHGSALHVTQPACQPSPL